LALAGFSEDNQSLSSSNRLKVIICYGQILCSGEGYFNLWQVNSCTAWCFSHRPYSSILVALGIKSKLNGNDIANYGIIIGIGAAILLGWLDVLIAISLPYAQQQEMMI